MKGLTDRQHEVLDWICRFRIENRFSPTVRELAAGIHVSEHAAYNYFATLKKKGYIAMQPGRPRSLRILKMASIFYGTVGDLFIQVAPKGTAKLSEIK